MTDKEPQGEGLLLTDEEISQTKADYANADMDAGYKPEHFRAKNWGEAAICQAQLAKCQAHYHKLMLLEYERGLRHALPAPGTEAYQKLRLTDEEYQQAKKQAEQEWIWNRTGINRGRIRAEHDCVLNAQIDKVLALLGEEK